MQEHALHRSLKEWIAGNNGQIEILVDGYWIDVVQDDLLIEIQTRSFSSIKRKLVDLLQRHRVRLIHPIAVEKWIIHLPAQGEQALARRKSPRRGRLEHIFNELIRFPELIAHPSFSLSVLLTREEEIRRANGRGSWRRKGQSIIDRRLLEVLGQYHLNTPQDFLDLAPNALSLCFTNQELARASKMRIELARKMTYCLRQMGALQVSGKHGREILYSVNGGAYNPDLEPPTGDDYE